MDPAVSPVPQPGQARAPACHVEGPGSLGATCGFGSRRSAPRTARAADRAGRLAGRHDARNPGGARSWAAASRDPGNWSSALRALPSAQSRDPQPPWTRSPLDRAARNPGQPVSAAAARPPFLRADPSAPHSRVLGQRCPLPAALSRALGAGVGWGKRDLGFALDFVPSSLGPLALCAFRQASADFVGRSDAPTAGLPASVLGHQPEGGGPPPFLHIPWPGKEPA